MTRERADITGVVPGASSVTVFTVAVIVVNDAMPGTFDLGHRFNLPFKFRNKSGRWLIVAIFFTPGSRPVMSVFI